MSLFIQVESDDPGSGLDKVGAHRLPEEEVSVGRDPECWLVLDDERISSEHFRIRFEEGSWFLCDEKSRNGTLLRDDPLPHGREEALGGGDTIRVPGFTLHVLDEEQVNRGFANTLRMQVERKFQDEAEKVSVGKVLDEIRPATEPPPAQAEPKEDEKGGAASPPPADVAEESSEDSEETGSFAERIVGRVQRLWKNDDLDILILRLVGLVVILIVLALTGLLLLG